MEYYYAPPRPWYRPRVRVLLFWALVLLALSTLTSYWSDARDAAARRQRELLAPPSGAACVIEIEQSIRDSSDARLVSGSFLMMNDQWVVLDSPREGERQQWIPLSRIVVLRVVDGLR